MTNSISTLGQALDQISRLKTQQRNMDLLATQLNTGKKTQRMSGLGNDVLLSQRTRTSIRTLDMYVSNITTVNRRAELMANSLDHIKKQAQETVTGMQLSLQQGDYTNFEALKDSAADIYNYLIDLVNTQDGDRYLFAGGDSSTKPISDTGFLETYMGEFVPDATNINNPPLTATGIVGKWGDGTLTTDEFIAAYHGVTEATLGYSDSLTSNTTGKLYARIDDNAQLDYTVLGNTQGIKDIITVMGVLKAMPPPENAPGELNDPDAITLDEDTGSNIPEAKQANFYAVMNDLEGMLNTAIKAIDQESFKLAQVQTRMNIVKNSHIQEINTMKSIVSDVEDVDTTEVAAKITQLQTQIEASYSVTALISNLSLVNFI